MLFTEDMQDIITIFKKHNVKFMLVGGFAVAYHGYTRTTQDIDFLLYPSKKNAKAIMDSLIEFGFGNVGIPATAFEKEGTAIHLGSEPNRIDLLTNLKGITNKTLFKNMKEIDFENNLINIISKSNLIKIKNKSDRLKDNADAEELNKGRKCQK